MVPRKTSYLPGAIGALLLFLLALPVAAVSFWMALPFFAGVAAIAYSQARRGLFADPAAALAGSFHLIAQGRFGEAGAALDGIKSPLAWVNRLVELQRSVIALRRGDVAGARDRLDVCLALPVGSFERVNSAYQIEAAHALRAFARASLGDYDGALEDVAAVRARPGAAAESLARVTLAEAVILERRGDRDQLRALLDRDQTLMLESCHPRERAIVRAYQRMLKVTHSTVYRRSAPREQEETGDEPALVDWVHKVAPGAAAFVRAPRPLPEGAPVEGLRTPSHQAHSAVAKARVAGRRAAAVGVGAGVVASLAAVIAVVGGGVAFLAAHTPDPSFASGMSAPSGPSGAETVLVAVLCAGLATGVFAAGRGIYKRLRPLPKADLARLGKARSALGRGRVDEAESTASLLQGSKHDAIAAQARSLAAAVAERKGQPKVMLDACDLGLGRLGPPRARLDLVRCELTAQRAVALAMLDRPDEASAELSSLGVGYAMQGRDRFRVRLIELSRAGNLEAAARFVEQGAAELPLGIRDELLADLVRAAAAPESAGLGELERLKDEVRTSPENRAWLEAAAPGLLDRFRRATEGDPEAEVPRARIADVTPEPPVAASGEVAAVDLEAEAELEAELLFSGDMGGRQRRPPIVS